MVNKYSFQLVLSIVYFLCLFYASNITEKLKVDTFKYYVILTIIFIVSLKVISCMFNK